MRGCQESLIYCRWDEYVTAMVLMDYLWGSGTEEVPLMLEDLLPQAIRFAGSGKGDVPLGSTCVSAPSAPLDIAATT